MAGRGILANVISKQAFPLIKREGLFVWWHGEKKRSEINDPRDIYVSIIQKHMYRILCCYLHTYSTCDHSAPQNKNTHHILPRAKLNCWFTVMLQSLYDDSGTYPLQLFTSKLVFLKNVRVVGRGRVRGNLGGTSEHGPG